MLDVEIKRAEAAFSDGRLDEAFELVVSSSVIEHRRGQKLAGQLAAAFAERGAGHLAQGLIQEALADCGKAEKMGGNLPEIARLRADVCKAIDAKRGAGRQHQARLARAKANMDNGLLSVGEDILKDADGVEAAILRDNAAAERAKVGVVLSRAREALDRGDAEGAMDIVKRGSLSAGAGSEAAELIGRVRSALAERITENLNAGRIDVARGFLGQLASLNSRSVETEQLAAAVKQCQRAADHLRRGRLSDAAELLGRLKVLLPQAKWLSKAAEQAKCGAEAVDGLRGGPLGLVLGDSGSKGSVEPERLAVVSRDYDAGSGALAGEGFADDNGCQVPDKFVLQIDGIGSYLVLCSDVVTVGPVSSSARPDVGLVTAPDGPVATIERSDGDYLVRSARAIGVNDGTVTEKLLANGDRIALTHRCRMKFGLPNAASTTAVLSLSSARLARADIRSVILMDREILIGPGSSCHVRMGDLDETVALFIRGGRLAVRTKERIEVDGGSYNANDGLAMNRPIRIGPMSVVLAEMKE